MHFFDVVVVAKGLGQDEAKGKAAVVAREAAARRDGANGAPRALAWLGRRKEELGSVVDDAAADHYDCDGKHCGKGQLLFFVSAFVAIALFRRCHERIEVDAPPRHDKGRFTT